MGKVKKLAQFISFSVLVYIPVYDVLSLNNSRFGDFADSIYTIELEIKRIPQIKIGLLHTPRN
jgi:hypothetical protein